MENVSRGDIQRFIERLNTAIDQALGPLDALAGADRLGLGRPPLPVGPARVQSLDPQSDLQRETSPTRGSACPPRPNGNTSAGQVPLAPSPSAMTSPRSRRITTATSLTEKPKRISIGRRPWTWPACLPTLGVSPRCMATSGTGAGTGTVRIRLAQSQILQTLRRTVGGPARRLLVRRRPLPELRVP